MHYDNHSDRNALASENHPSCCKLLASPFLVAMICYPRATSTSTSNTDTTDHNVNDSNLDYNNLDFNDNDYHHVPQAAFGTLVMICAPKKSDG